MNRRAFLGTASAAAFAVPMIVSVEPAAAAALLSPPPGQPRSEVITSGPTEPPEGGTLPRTGAPVAAQVAAGAAAIAGGALLHTWASEGREPPVRADS